MFKDSKLHSQVAPENFPSCCEVRQILAKVEEEEAGDLV